MSPPSERAALGALVAGGRARRLGGRAKGLLRVGGVPIVDRLAALLGDFCDRVVVIGDPAGPYAGRGLPVLPDAIDAGAPGGVYTALRAAPRAGWICAMACDLPHLDRATVARLWARRGGQATLYVAGGRRQPLAGGLWHTDARPAFEAAFAEGWPGFGGILSRLRAVEVEAGSGAAFANLNTPADAARLGVALEG